MTKSKSNSKSVVGSNANAIKANANATAAIDSQVDWQSFYHGIAGVMSFSSISFNPHRARFTETELKEIDESDITSATGEDENQNQRVRFVHS